jgi:TolA-binding protein
VRVRTVLIATALLSSIIGGAVVYLVLTVPNDLAADALLKSARKEIAAGNNSEARVSLSRIVQQYPRTDAAAAATVALTSLADSERQKLSNSIDQLRRETNAQKTQLAALAQRVTKMESTPPPAPIVVKAEPKPAPKRAPKKSSSRKRRR